MGLLELAGGSKKGQNLKFHEKLRDEGVVLLEVHKMTIFFTYSRVKSKKIVIFCTSSFNFILQFWIWGFLSLLKKSP